MSPRLLKLVPALSLVLAACAAEKTESAATAAVPTAVERGKYLVTTGGCHDCHTPKLMGPQGPAIDSTRMFAGHPANEPIGPLPADVPGPNGWVAATNGHQTAWVGPWGVTYAANLTPHASGMGAWTEAQFIATMRTGKHLGTGRPVLPPMPIASLAAATDEDLKAIFAYLKSVPAVDNTVPAPQPPKG